MSDVDFENIRFIGAKYSVDIFNYLSIDQLIKLIKIILIE